MKTWILLLRGINVGGNNIIKMKDLRDLMEANGYQDVKTYIQSGNIVFKAQSADSEAISELIESKYGFRPLAFILSYEDLSRSVELCPYQSDQGKTIHYFFLHSTPESIDEDFLNCIKDESEQYQLINQVFYLYAPNGIGRSKLVDKLHKALPNVAMTARNLNTINKLMTMAHPTVS